MPLPHNYPPFHPLQPHFGPLQLHFHPFQTLFHLLQTIFPALTSLPHTLRGSPYHFPCFDLAPHTLRAHPFTPCPIHNMQGKCGRHCSFLDCIHEMAHFCGRNTYFPVTQSRSTNTAFLYSNEYQRIINKACSWTLSLEAEHEQ